MYLNQITFPDRESEGSFFAGIMRTVYDSYYPYQVLSTSLKITLINAIA